MNNDRKSLSRPLVCKIVDRSKLSKKGEKMIQNEVANLTLIQSKGVIKMYKTYKSPISYYIFTEFCNGGDMRQLLLARGGKFSLEESRKLIKKVVKGIYDMHQVGIVHRDIKLANILINFKGPISVNGIILTEEDICG